MNFYQARDWWEYERSTYIRSLNLWWSEKFFSKKRYIDTKWEDTDLEWEETEAQIIIPDRAVYWIRWWKSQLEIFKWAFFWKSKTEDEFLSIVRDHEWKHAHISHSFPELFDAQGILTRNGLDEIRVIVEEIICDDFQIHQIQMHWMQVRSRKLKALKKENTRTKKLLNETILWKNLWRKAQEVVDVLNWDHIHSDEIRFWTWW